MFNTNMSLAQISSPLNGTQPNVQLMQVLQPIQNKFILVTNEIGQQQLLRVLPEPVNEIANVQNNVNNIIKLVPSTLAKNNFDNVTGTQTGQSSSQLTTQSQRIHTNVQRCNDLQKCGAFFINLIAISKNKPEKNEVLNLIQDLVDAKLNAETFCENLEKRMNSPQHIHLINFLNKILPLFRQSLMLKKITIKGIRPPKQNDLTQNLFIANQQQKQKVNVQLPESTIVNNMGSICVRPLVTSHQNNYQNIGSRPTLVPISNSKSIGNEETNTKKSETLKRKASSSIKNKTIPRPPPAVLTSDLTGPQTCLMPSLALLEQPTTIQQVQMPIKSTLKSPPTEKKVISVPAPEFHLQGVDDLNDICAMSDINIAQETQSSLGFTSLIGAKTRSHTDTPFLQHDLLVDRIKQITINEGLKEFQCEVPKLICHVVREQLKNLLEKCADVAEHRLDFNGVKRNSEKSINTRAQLKCLEDIDEIPRKKQMDVERQFLLRIAKCPPINENPEEERLKADINEMLRMEAEELRWQETNNTALEASKSKKQLDPRFGPQLHSQVPREMIKQVTMRDFAFVLEHEKIKSSTLQAAKSKFGF